MYSIKENADLLREVQKKKLKVSAQRFLKQKMVG